MKKLGIVFLILLFWACGVHHNGALTYSNEVIHYAQLYASKEYFGKTFYYGINNKDTVVFISGNNMKIDAGTKTFFVNIQGLEKVSQITSGNDTLHFYYCTKSVNSDLKILTGDGAPGRYKNTMYTYSCFPLIIKRPESFLRIKAKQM